MDEGERERIERDVRALCNAGSYESAATLLLRGYGPEILSFLHALNDSENAATDAFAELGEIVWRNLPGFAWESSSRTWLYGIARNVTRAARRVAARRRRREATLGDAALENVQHAARTETLPFLRTQAKTRLSSLREALPVADRMLLILRVDRKLEWNDLAQVLAHTEGAPLDAAATARAAARLRKRFQQIKDRLREMARREGLVG